MAACSGTMTRHILSSVKLKQCKDSILALGNKMFCKLSPPTPFFQCKLNPLSPILTGGQEDDVYIWVSRSFANTDEKTNVGQNLYSP